jgi:hypothetical protein
VTLIQGRVVDAAGRPVPRAPLVFVVHPGSAPDIAQLSGEDGRFVFALAPGKYVLAARSDAAGSGQASFEVKDEREQSVTITLT